jgi:hypothetical protein
MMAASGEYSTFLTTASQAAPGILEPTLAVDLLRHTHMGFPRKYAQDCVRLSGMLPRRRASACPGFPKHHVRISC